MLTKWAKNFLSCCMYTNVLPMHNYTGSSSAALVEVKDLNGDTLYSSVNLMGFSNNLITSQLITKNVSASYGVAIGSGSTPPSENDYTLENQIIGITSTAPVVTYAIDSEKYKVRVDYTIQNDTGNSITINEIGLFRMLPSTQVKGNNASAGVRISVMFDRTVLENPVTIPNGEAGVIRYEFDYGV